MNCMRCGREILGNRVFCDSCLEEMARNPVDPSTPVQLPSRPIAAAAKRPGPKKKVLSPEEQLPRLKKRLKWLWSAIVALILALGIVIAMLILVLNNPPETGNPIGKNYSTVQSTDT